MEPEARIFPRSSAFEMLLGKVYLELWELQDNPEMYVRRVRHFVNVDLPTMFQKKVAAKFPNFFDAEEEKNKRINRLHALKASVDPFSQDIIDTQSIPAEEAELAKEVWHCTVDVLTEAGFNFPMAMDRERRKVR